jgi:dynein heavy chain
MKKLKKRWNRISMGQGQEARAREIVEECWRSGEWALLENCHLGIPFLIQLEDMLRNVLLSGGGGDEGPKITIHEDARLFVTSEPSKEFPIGLLQMSVKLTNEPPQGIRAGIVRSLSWMTQDSLEAFQRSEWKPLLFTQCFLHSIVQERRKFGPIGFSVPYEFNQGDWLASMQFLQNHLTLLGEDARKNPVSWETVRYMISQIQYGGRITDNNDRILFDTIALTLFDPKILTPQPGTANFVFCQGNGYRYGLPTFAELPKHREFVLESYPDVDPPEVFGMHANADITYRAKQATTSLNTIIDCQPRGAGASNSDAQARLEEVVEKFVVDFAEAWNPSKKEKLEDPNPITMPLSIFAGQEIDRLAAVIRTIRSTCNDLKLAWKGKLIFSPALQEAAASLQNARVPPAWIAVSWPSSDVSMWTNDVKQRRAQLDVWAKTGRPAHFWLPGFFNPQGFLTGVRQEITRSKNESMKGNNSASVWPLNQVEARFDVRGYFYTEGVEREDRDPGVDARSVLIYGLFLDGAAWQTGPMKKLIDAPLGEGPQRMPVILVSAGLEGEKVVEQQQQPMGLPGAKKPERKAPNVYSCPLYKYYSRTDNNFICNIQLPCEEKDTFWRLRGTCLLGSRDMTS